MLMLRSPTNLSTPAFSRGSLRQTQVTAGTSTTHLYLGPRRPPPPCTVIRLPGTSESGEKNGPVDKQSSSSEWQPLAPGNVGGGSSDVKNVGHGGSGGDGKQSGMGVHYREMLRDDPENPLLLRNYGKFLQEVEGDVAGAENCYARAVLAAPSDGEVLSLYGNLVWENHGDEEKAGHYFQRAALASPEDCHVLGSYAHFLWNFENDANALTTVGS